MADANIPTHLKYTAEHEWLIAAEDGTATIGITHHAQAALGDITFVELPAVGDSLNAGETFGVVESVKAASDLYLPVAGEVVAVNNALEDAPETLNADPYGEGWIVKIKLANPAEIDGLLDADGYEQTL